MHRWLVLMVLVGCEPPAEPDAPAIAHRVYAPGPSAWPLGPIHGRIGRGVAPQAASSVGVAGTQDLSLHVPTIWAIPKASAAIVAGIVDNKPAVERIELDVRRVIWRDLAQCAAPVVGVTASAVVCADPLGVRAIRIDDGTPLWRTSFPFVAMTGERVVTERIGEVAVLDANTGAELVKLALPAGVKVDQIVASCTHELYVVRDGKLSRIENGKLVWTVAVGTVVAVDACVDRTVLVTASSELGTSLVAIDHETGKLVNRIDGVRGSWPARDRAEWLEISTASGVRRWRRDFSENVTDARLAALPSLGDLLGSFGAMRLVRATPRTAVVLDGNGVRAYVPLAERGAALGDHTILAGSSVGSAGNTPRLVDLPNPWNRPLHLTSTHTPVTVPAELRDLPAAVPVDLEHAIARPDTAMHAVVAITLDDTALYAVTLEHPVDETGHAGLARFDLKTRTWMWGRADGCGAGAPIAIATARGIVACATAKSVRATTHDGAASWEWTTEHVDAIEAAGDVVIAHDADRLTVLDADDGRVLGRIASDDGASVRAAVLDLDGMSMVVTYEGGRVVGRLPQAAMVPAWSLAVDGVVSTIASTDHGVLVSLEDGDAYRIDARTGDSTAVAGLDLVWRAAAELVTGEAPGGPVPPATLPVPPQLPEVYKPTDLEAAPAIATPWPPPPPMRESWQYTLYEASGAVRARNDYALEPPIAPAPARGRGSPLVVASRPGLRDLLVIDPEHGDPMRRVMLPDDAPSGVTFSSIVDGQPVTGTILAAPLRVVVF